MNRLGAEWKNLLEIGATRGLTSTWYQPLDRADQFFVEPSLAWKDNRRDVYIEGDLVAVYSTSYWNVGLKAGKNFGTSSQLRAELNMGQGDAKPDSQTEGLELPVYNNTDRTTVTAAYEIDTFDNHNFPHRGTRLKAIWNSSLVDLGADYAYDKASLSYTKAMTFAERHTIIAGLSGGITLDEDAPYFDQFQLGGLFKLSGLADMQLIGQNMVSGELLYYTNLSKSLHVGVGLETGNTWNDRSEAEFADLLWGGVVFAGLETIIGPVYLAYGYTEGESSGRLRFALGKTF
jgi:NTE family protein